METFSFLSQLNELDRDWVSAHSYYEHLKSGQTLPLEANKSVLGVVIEGALSCEKNGRLERLCQGDVIGEASLLSDDSLLQVYRALEPTKILMVRADALSSRLTTDKIFAARLYRALAGQLATTLIRRIHAEGQQINEAELADIANAMVKFKKRCRLVSRV